jgi:hypothetical protein
LIREASEEIAKAITFSDYPNDGKNMERQISDLWIGNVLFQSQDKGQLQKGKWITSKKEMECQKEPGLFHILKL